MRIRRILTIKTFLPSVRLLPHQATYSTLKARGCTVNCRCRPSLVGALRCPQSRSVNPTPLALFEFVTHQAEIFCSKSQAPKNILCMLAILAGVPTANVPINIKAIVTCLSILYFIANYVCNACGASGAAPRYTHALCASALGCHEIERLECI